MTKTHSRARQLAEIAFTKAQSEFLGRETAVEELDAVVRARQEKTARLRKARLARVQENCASAPSALATKRPKKA